MKHILTLTLILPSIICFGQKQDVTAKTTTKEQAIHLEHSDKIEFSAYRIYFSAYEKSKVEEHDNLIKQFNLVVKNFKAMDSTYWKFINDELQVNKVDFSRLSQDKDSLKITPEGIFYILKPKKK